MDYETGKFMEQILANQAEFKEALTEIYRAIAKEEQEEPKKEEKK